MRCPQATARLTFREMRRSDLDFMAELLGDPRSMAFYPRPFRRDEARAWIEWNPRLYQERGFGLWIVSLARGGRPVGDCGITPQVVDGAEELELGYHIHPRLQRQGYATEAATAVREHARSVLGVGRLVAIIHPRNLASRRVAQKIGLELEHEVEHAGHRRLLYSRSL